VRSAAVALFAAALASAQTPAGSASVRKNGASLGTIRLGAANQLWFSWQVGIASDAYPKLTFVEAAARADALGLGSILGVNTQQAAYEIPKKLDWRLTAGERAALLARLRELNVRMAAYRVDALPVADAERRKLFEFAKAMSVQWLLVPSVAATPEVDKLAHEFAVAVVVEAGATPLAGLSRIGLRADASGKPVDRTMVVTFRPPSAGAGDFFLEAFRMELKPMFVLVDGPDLARSVDELEKALRPAMIARVRQVIDSPHGAIRGPERLSAEARAQVEAAAPREAIAKPKKPRRLLVVDLNMYSGHSTIPHGNLLLDLMGKRTGAYEAVFSNDLNNLKYPKIKEFDAIFLNNVVGMVFPDPEVRDGLMRYMREGGGLGGVHGTTYAALDWPEFTDMLQGTAGAHRVEKKILKIDDPSSPLTSHLGAESIEHTDEFYHFPASSPYSREKARVLISIDVEKSDMATAGRLCTECTRPDHDYAMSWIRSYGKGRVFCTPLGHTPILFTDPRWTRHLLAGVQFILGDLEADTTPSAKLAGRKK
jgi:type 1 glutamine amidotransferase